MPHCLRMLHDNPDHPCTGTIGYLYPPSRTQSHKLGTYEEQLVHCHVRTEVPNFCPCTVLAEPHQPDIAATGHRYHDCDLVPHGGQHRPHLAVDPNLPNILLHVWCGKCKLKS